MRSLKPFFLDRWTRYPVGKFLVLLNLTFKTHRYIATGIYHEGLRNWIKKSIFPGDIVIDEGARTGYFTALMLKTGAFVYASEPSLLAHQLVDEYNPEDNFPRLLWMNVHFSDKTAIVPFIDGSQVFEQGHSKQSEINLLDEGNLIEVNTIQMDELLEEKTIRLLKLDLLGPDEKVLLGAQKLLRADKIENIAVVHSSADDGFIEFLSSFRFRPHYLTKNGLPIPQESDELVPSSRVVLWMK